MVGILCKVKFRAAVNSTDGLARLHEMWDIETNLQVGIFSVFEGLPWQTPP